MTVAGGRDSLTPRQRESLAAYARRGSMKEAAHDLGIAPRTVKWHLAAARERLSAASLLEVVILVAEAVGPPSIAGAAPLDRLAGDPPGATIAAMIATGADLRDLRLAAGLSQAQLARRLGLCRQRISAAEGSVRASPVLAARIRGVLG